MSRLPDIGENFGHVARVVFKRAEHGMRFEILRSFFHRDEVRNDSAVPRDREALTALLSLADTLAYRVTELGEGQGFHAGTVRSLTPLFKSKAPFYLALLFAPLAACNSLPPAVAPALAGATGAYLGHDLSDGNAAGAVLGAVAGVAAGSAVSYWNQTGKEKAYGSGYDQGRSDEVKRLYWASKRLHEGGFEEPLKRGYYEIPVPEHVTSDGVVIEAHTQVVEVIEP